MAAAAFAVAVLTSSAWRLHFGVDFTDEAYYASVPYRFFLGDTPYVSDLTVGQNTGLLTWPFVSAWIRLSDGTDGLMLMLRYLYFAIRVAVACLAFHVLSARVPRFLAAAASLMVVGFVLHGIPAPSYNTVASSAMSTALLCTVAFVEHGGRRYVVTGGMAALVAAFVHPVTAPISVTVILYLVWRAPTPVARHEARRCVTAVLLVTLAVAVVGLTAVGADNVRTLVGEAGGNTLPSAGIRGVVGFPARLMDISRAGYVQAGIWATMWFAHRISSGPLTTAFALYTVLALLSGPQAGMAWLALAALPLTNAARQAGGRREWLEISLLSVACGFLVAAYSTMGVFNAAVGAETGAMLSFLAVHRLAAARPRPSPVREFVGAGAAGLAALTVVLLSLWQWRFVYRDDSVYRLAHVVPTGAYRGLRTTPAKAAYLDSLQRTLASLDDSARSLMSFEHFPAAHLMVDIPPALRMTYILPDRSPSALRWRATLAADVARARKPMLVLQVFREHVTIDTHEHWEYPDSDPLWSAIQSRGPRLLAKNSDFAVYEVQAPR